MEKGARALRSIFCVVSAPNNSWSFPAQIRKWLLNSSGSKQTKSTKTVGDLFNYCVLSNYLI